VPESEAPDPLTERFAEVIDAGLQLGASLARTLASATGSKDVEPTGKPPLDDVVKFGTATATNLIGLVASGARTGMDVTNRAAGAAGAGRSTPSPTSTPEANTPYVTEGSILRMPLLVENTGPTPTRELTFATTSIARDGCEDGTECTCLLTDVVQFDPPSLVVGARDFEKLTLRIAAPAGTPAGDYVASISAGDGWFSTTIRFSVVTGT
jgi:hypothetical protein